MIWSRRERLLLDSLREAQDQLSLLQRQLESETARRIAMETLASERRGEVEWLREDRISLQAQLAKLSEERLKSLDALNLKLMESRVEAPPPDLAQFNAVRKVKMQLVQGMKDMHRTMDEALLRKQFPGIERFLSGGGGERHPMNEAAPPEQDSGPQAAD